MSKTKHLKPWYGCSVCLYKPEQDIQQSTKDWAVFECGPCPKCGKQMGVNVESAAAYLEHDKEKPDA